VDIINPNTKSKVGLKCPYFKFIVKLRIPRNKMVA
jgi:hypothetical protein